MGNTASNQKPLAEDTIFYAPRETPITFAPSLINQLADSADNAVPNEGRQNTLDAHIRQRIEREITQLRRDEAEIQAEVQRQLERENTEREKDVPGGLDSRQVAKDLDAIKHKIERQSKRSATIEYRVKPQRDAVVECYRKNPTRTLDCWREVDQFRLAVQEIENEFIQDVR